MAGAATPLGNMVIKLGLDDADFGKGVQNAKKQVTYLAKEMQANMKIADLAGSQMGKFGARYDGLTKIIGAQERQVKSLKKAYDESFVDGKATESTKRLATQLQDANGRLAANKEQLKQVAGAMAEYQVKNEGLTGAINRTSEQMVKSGKAMQSVGSAMTKGLTVPIVAGMAAVTKAAIDWESDFAGVKKTVDEVTDANGKVTYSYKDLENELRGLAKTLPSSHKEIANVAEAAGQLGIKTKDVTSFTKTMIDLGESTNLSADEAATAIAKMANITGTKAKDFRRFGSTIVELGNNFATTERDIVEMGTRLASSGKIAGLTEPEILALATAMSSVGVEAEAGGTAMSQTLSAMEKAVVGGGDKLKQFADVSGMTSNQFAKAWKEKPIDALSEFIKGLGKLDEKGESATLVLDEMGLSGIRQSNMLKALGLASENLSGAIGTSNKAWKENTALTEEANKRYETTESKLKMLKNEAKDTAIEFGGPFVDALRDGLKASEPLIRTIGEMAKKFSSADPEMQKMIVGFLGITAVAGPLLSITGKLTGGIGSLGGSFIDLLAKMAKRKAIGETAKLLETGALSASEFGGAVSAASGAKGVGGLMSAIGLANPVVLGLVGAGGALAIGYGAWKLWGEEAYNAGKRTQEWGSDVGKATGETLSIMQSNTQQATGEFALLEQGVSENSTKMIANFEAIGKAIETDLVNQISTFREAVGMMPQEVQQAAQEITEGFSDEREKALKIVEENNKAILDIKKKYTDENGQVTAQGAKMISDLMTQSTSEYLKITIKDADQRKKVLDSMTGDVENASEEQAKTWLQNLGKQRSQTQNEYKSNLKAFKEYLRDKGQLDTEEGKLLVELFEKSTEESTLAIDKQMALITEKYPELARQIVYENGMLASDLGGMADITEEANRILLEKAGTMSEKLATNSRRTANTLKWVADQGTQSGKTWNALELLDKEGKVKTNASEIITEASKDTQKWNEIRMVLQEANIDSNAKKMIGEAAIANGWWDGMAWEDKEAVLQDEFSITTYKALNDNGTWQEMSFEEKKAILYSNTPETMARTLYDLGIWDKLELETKDLLANNSDLLAKIKNGSLTIEDFNRHEPELKHLLGDSYDVTRESTKAQSSLGEFNRVTTKVQNLVASDQSTYSAGKAKGSVEKFNRTTTKVQHLKATDDASWNAGRATGAVQNFGRQGDKKVTLTTITKNITQWITEKFKRNEKGTDFHKGGLALVNDQQGPLYRELIQHPTGEAYVPQGRNVMLDLPRGSKVYTATQTKKLIPNYAEGVGVPRNSTMVRNLESVGNNVGSTTVVNNDNRELVSLMRQMLNTIARLKPEIVVNTQGTISDLDLRNISQDLAFLTQIEQGGLS